MNISLKNKIQLILSLKFAILLITFHGVCFYVVYYGTFLGVGVVLYNFLVYNIVWWSPSW
jgi:hypothetical protein